KGDIPQMERVIYQIGRRIDEDPCASIAPLVHMVVNQERVTAHRNTLPSGIQVSLGRDSILVVAEVVGDVCQHLNKGDANIWNMSLLPLRDGQGQPVQDELAETGIVFRQVIDLWLDK